MLVRKQLNETIKQMFYQGMVVEEFVMKSIEETLGGECKKSSFKEDRYQHIDFWWNSPRKGILGIDVKGMKKNKRTDKEFDDSIHWVEIKNVGGKPGWLYGEANYIAFVTKKQIIFAKLKKLQSFIEEKIKDKVTTTVNPNECYIPYQRYGRKDLIVKCMTNDLLEISDFTIDYGDKS